MKRILLLVLACSLISEWAWSQDGIKTKVEGFSKLDSVSTAEEVEAIIAAIDKRYAKYKVGVSKSFTEKDCFKLSDLTNLAAITKADLDGNGFSDLLVIGTLDNRQVILSLISSASGAIDMHIITRHFTRTCSIAQVIYEGAHALVEFRQFGSYDQSNDTQVKAVRLAFKYGSFVEFNPNPPKYNIEQIEYKNDGGVWIPNSSFAIEINANGKDRYSKDNPDFLAQRHNKYINVYGNLPDTIHSELVGLLNYSDFPKLKDNYAITATDHATARLKITYDGGKVKTIKDYGLIGTYSLSRVYKIMHSIRKSVAWTPESAKGLVPLPGISN
jgi:hypothetical protein